MTEPPSGRVANFLGLARRPLDDEVLIPGERVVQRQLQHWMVLVPAGLRAVAALWLALLVVLGLPARSMVPLEWALAAVALVGLWDWARRHKPRDLVARVIGLLLLGLVLGFRQRGIAVLFAVAFCGAFFVQYAQWRWYRVLYVTNRRMLLTRGIFDRTYDMMPITKITDLRMEVSWLGDALGYGAIIVESAGQDQALRRLTYLTDVDAFVRDVISLATRQASMDD